ncbi:hypothetical protein OIU76_013852 [Salix suchowensis]|nr:hypothetical protein OIU76_013852 [Salix suchowensis]
MEPNASNNMQPDHCLEIAPMGAHKVVPPPHRSTLQKLKSRLKETFFPDDPLLQFKRQTLGKKWILAAQYFFPILQWGPKYSFKLFKSDIVSGLTIASLAIPQGISYAKLASLPPIVGLYSSFVPPLVYAVLGSSRDLAVGPVSIASLILGSMLTQEVSPVNNPLLFLQLAFSSTFFAGLFQASLGFLRVRPCQTVQWLELNDHLKVSDSNSEKYGKDHPSMRNPKLFWVSAGAPLVSVILSTILVFAFKAENHGISVIGKLQEGLNPPSWNMLHFHGSNLGLVVKTGLVTGIISLTVAISIFKILLQVTRPKTMILGNIPGTDIFRNLHHYKDATRIPGFLILSIEAPINFANATYLKERIQRWINEYETEEDIKQQSSIHFLILDLSAVSAIDTSGVSLFKDLKKAVETKGAELVLVNPVGEVLEKLLRADDARDITGPDTLYLTVGEAVAALSSTMKGQSSSHV